MGDRSNLVGQFGSKTKRVYLYSHWDGTRLAIVLRDTIKAGLRLEDDSYFTRILFNNMTRKAYSPESGYGISPMITDNEHEVLVYDCQKGRVWVEDGAGVADGRKWTFEEFAALSDKEARATMEPVT